MLQQSLVGGARHIMPQRLYKRPVGITDMLIARAEQYDCTFAVCFPCRLYRKPRLADSRLPRQQGKLSLPLLGRLQRRSISACSRPRPYRPNSDSCDILDGNAIDSRKGRAVTTRPCKPEWVQTSL